MLLELAVGDAYGAGFEYVDADLIRSANHLTSFVKHPRHAIQGNRILSRMVSLCKHLWPR